MVATQSQGNQNSEISKLMKDRVVLVTGASRGIGAATAKLLGRHGAAVGVNYYSSETAAQEVVDAIASEGEFLLDLLQKSIKTIKSICVYLCPSVVKNPKSALLQEV